jgi:C4-dicarboxylate transporter, DctM subunit
MDWSLQLLTVGLGVSFLLLSGLWIPFTIGTVAISIMLWSGGFKELNAIGLVFWGGANSFVLTAIPLYILMAEILIASQISAKLYRALTHFTRYLPGGLFQTNIVGSAIFSAVCGSSMATAAAISRVALPELRNMGYNMRISCGSLAAGGTLGILIPPSGAMIIYGVLTDTSIARLFLAGILPGIFLALMFMVFLAVGSRQPDRGISVGGNFFANFLLILPFIILVFMVIGSIYLGWATPTEAAGIGVLVALAIGAMLGDLNLKLLWEALQSTAKVSGSLLIIIAMAQTLSYSLSISGMAADMAKFVVGLGLSPRTFLIAMIVLYAVLGCIMDGVAMMLITVPILFPVVQALGIDPVYFGVLLVVMMEFGLLTPPFGLNLFVIQQISKEPMNTVVLGSIPFCAIIFLFVVILLFVPNLALWLSAA